MTYSVDATILLGMFYAVLCANMLPWCECVNEVALRRKLFQERPYDQKVCPEEGVTKVHTNLILLQIESVDEKAQVVTSNIQLTCAWCDPYMSWNESQYNITALSVGTNYLWTPDVVLVNSADGKYSRNREHYALILRHDGYVRFMFQDLWKTICKVRSKYFPFDRQRCTIIIRSGAHDHLSIEFVQRRAIQRHSFIRGEWELIHSYTEITDERVSDFGQTNFSLVRFTLILTRNQLYYVIKIILPFSLVSCVTLFTFLLPPQTGEKLTLNVTVLLSLVIYLQLLSQYIPKSDDETPILTLFCNANFFLVFLSCVMTIYVLYLYHRPSTSHIVCVPVLVKVVLLDYIGPLVYCNVHGRVRKQNLTKPIKEKKLMPPKSLNSIEKRLSNIFTVTTTTPSAHQQGIELLRLLHQIKLHIRTRWLLPLSPYSEHEAGSELLKMDNQQRLDEWQYVALVLDRLFFLFFVIVMPCTALLFVSARLSGANDFDLNDTSRKVHLADAQCLYKPAIT